MQIIIIGNVMNMHYILTQLGISFGIQQCYSRNISLLSQIEKVSHHNWYISKGYRHALYQFELSDQWMLTENQ